MDPAVFDELDRALAAEGPDAAVRRLCDRLREAKDYNSLFYALLMQKRCELGVSPIPTAPSKDLPAAAHAPFEEAIRQAGRHVGNLYIQEGNLPQAWAYFRMIGEPGPVRDALEARAPADDEDVQPLVHIAYYEGVHPRKGFDWILKRYGICNAITTLSGGQDARHAADDRRHCLRRLVQALYQELRERLTAEIERHDGRPPPEASEPEGTRGVVVRLLEGRDWLFADDCYHIDTSHLSSVVQMSVNLEPCEELELARELCAYGRRLRGRFQHPGDPPFEDQYAAFDAYLSVLTGEDVDGGLAYFHAQADKADPETVGTYPAEVLVNLLLKAGRPKEALDVARKHLVKATNRQLTCPGVVELSQQVHDYRTLAEAAREQGDVVHFLAARLAARGAEV